MSSNRLSIGNPTGGLHYHLRAFLHRKRWQPFCDMVETWLKEWSLAANLTATETLVLIGPNAGYTLPSHFLAKFRNIILVEPDPLAYLMFRARFSSVRVNLNWISRDFFGVTDGGIKIGELFKIHPQAAFLFCNVLGQLPLLLKQNRKIDIELYMKNLGQFFFSECGRPKRPGDMPLKLASYHDRFSTSRLRPNETVDHLTGELFGKEGGQAGKEGGLFVKREFPWRLTPTIEHQIEFVYNNIYDNKC